MIKKILALQEIGMRNAQIEQNANLGNGCINRVLKTKKYRQSTEAKINILIAKIIKILVCCNDI